MKKLILGLVIIILLLVAGFFGYRAMNNIQVKEGLTGPYFLVYANLTGDYSKSGVVLDKVSSFLKGNGINSTQAFGIYFDNPALVETSKLRSLVGYLVDREEYGKLVLERDKQFKYAKLPESTRVIAEFPYKDQSSITNGISKVYPAIIKYLSAKGYTMGAVMEIYDFSAGKIIYLTEIKK